MILRIFYVHRALDDDGLRAEDPPSITHADDPVRHSVQPAGRLPSTRLECALHVGGACSYHRHVGHDLEPRS